MVWRASGQRSGACSAVVTVRALGAGALLLGLAATRTGAGTTFVDQAHPSGRADRGKRRVRAAPRGSAAARGGLKESDPGAAPTGIFSSRVVPAVTRHRAAFQFTTTARGALRVDLHDASGRHVRALLEDADMAPGLHSLNFDARDDHGHRLASGVYSYRAQAAERSVAGRFVVAR